MADDRHEKAPAPASMAARPEPGRRAGEHGQGEERDEPETSRGEADRREDKGANRANVDDVDKGAGVAETDKKL